MRKMSLVVIGVLFFGCAASAQRDGNKADMNQRAMRQMTSLKEELKLTDLQFQKMMTLNKQQAEKRQEMRAAAKDDRLQMRQEMKEEREKYKAELETILTPEQLVTYQKIMADRKAEMQDNRGKGDRPDKKKKRKDTK